MEKKNDQVYVDPINLIFAKAMEIVTWIGLVFMIIFGVLYLAGLPSFVNMKVAIANWHLPVGHFWEEVKSVHIHGYHWFLGNIHLMDCLSMVGICILALAPFASLVAALSKVGGQHKAFVFLFLILIVEFVFAILKPIIMPGVGGH